MVQNFSAAVISGTILSLKIPCCAPFPCSPRCSPPILSPCALSPRKRRLSRCPNLIIPHVPWPHAFPPYFTITTPPDGQAFCLDKFFCLVYKQYPLSFREQTVSKLLRKLLSLTRCPLKLLSVTRELKTQLIREQ